MKIRCPICGFCAEFAEWLCLLWNKEYRAEYKGRMRCRKKS